MIKLKNQPGGKCCDQECPGCSDCRDGTRKHIKQVLFAVVDVPFSVTAWREERLGPAGSPTGFRKITLTGMDQFNGPILVKRDPATCEWDIPTVTHSCDYTAELYVGRADVPACPDVDAGPADTESGTCDVSFTPWMLDPDQYVRFHDILVVEDIPPYAAGGTRLTAIYLDPQDHEWDPPVRLADYSPCGVSQLTFRPRDMDTYIDNVGIQSCPGTHGVGSGTVTGSTATSSTTTVCCEESMVNQVTLNLSGLPAALVQWEKITQPDDSITWRKYTYYGLDGFNGSHIFSRDENLVWTPAEVFIAGEVQYDNYEDAGGCPGGLTFSAGRQYMDFTLRHGKASGSGSSLALHEFTIQAYSVFPPYGQLIFQPRPESEFNPCGTSTLTALSFTQQASYAYGGCEIVAEYYYGEATSDVVEV